MYKLKIEMAKDFQRARVGGDKIYFFRGYQGPGRLGTWEERGTGKKGGKGNMGRKGRPTKPRNK